MALPKRFPDRDDVAAVYEDAAALDAGAEAGAEHRLAGRILARRDLGKLVFADLVDRTGRIQLLIRPDERSFVIGIRPLGPNAISQQLHRITSR